MSGDIFQRIARAKTRWVSDQEEGLSWQLAKMKSPIEQLFFLALLNHGWEFFLDQNRWSEAYQLSQKILGRHAAFSLASSASLHYGFVQPEITIDGRRMRPDFAFIAPDYGVPWTKKVFVELDGHDFHERTKEQARRDKSKDRLLQANGWIVFRYTGSEMYEDADGHVEQFLAMLDAVPRVTGAT